MEILYKKLEEIIPYDNNPRDNAEAVEYVAASIKEFGFKVPVVIAADGVIIAGHTRYLAAKKLGITSVPCVIADDLSQEQIKAYRLADNKTGELAAWDQEKLAQELELLSMDMDVFGFDLHEETEEELGQEDVQEVERVVCPRCGKVFEVPV